MKTIKIYQLSLPAVLAISLLLPLSSGQTASAASKRANILFIIVDDQSPFDLKVYNPKSALESPNIDRLAAEGMVSTARITWVHSVVRSVLRRGTW